MSKPKERKPVFWTVEFVNPFIPNETFKKCFESQQDVDTFVSKKKSNIVRVLAYYDYRDVMI